MSKLVSERREGKEGKRRMRRVFEEEERVGSPTKA